MDVYADSTYKFSVSYPADFEFRPQSAEKRRQLTPMPTGQDAACRGIRECSSNQSVHS